LDIRRGRKARGDLAPTRRSKRCINPRIFLVGEDREHLITLEETGYVEEAVLQDYLVDYPDLLPGDQIDETEPRRWVLISREVATDVPPRKWTGR
jgi:hypothetical protein